MPMASIGATERRVKPEFDLVYSLFLLFLLVEAYVLLDPFYFGFGLSRFARDPGPIKYAPLAIALGASMLGIIGKKLSRMNFPGPASPALQAGGPLLVLCACIVLGSMYARFAQGIFDSFLPAGIGMLGLPIGIVLYYTAQNPPKLVATFFWALLIASPYEIAWIILSQIRGGQAFHEGIFLIVPLAVYFFHALQKRWLAWAVLICMLLTGLATNKYTGYATLLITAALLILPPFFNYFKRQDITWRLLLSYLALVCLLAFSALTAYLFAHRDQYLPTGNVPVRLQAYLSAWHVFVHSPVYGDAFSGTSLRSLVGITVHGHTHIVTHSDFLDILSHGGIIGLTLYLSGLYRIIGGAVAASTKPLPPADRASINGLLGIIACGIFVMLFNPLMIAVQISTPFWIALGFLAGLGSQHFPRSTGTLTGSQ